MPPLAQFTFATIDVALAASSPFAGDPGGPKRVMLVFAVVAVVALVVLVTGVTLAMRKDTQLQAARAAARGAQTENDGAIRRIACACGHAFSIGSVVAKKGMWCPRCGRRIG